MMQCFRRRTVLAMPALLAASPGTARAAAPGFQGWLDGVGAEAVRSGVRRGVVEAAFAGLVPDPKVIELDHHQPEFTETWAQYSGQTLTAARISEGRGLYGEYRTLVSRVLRAYPAGAGVIMGIWGLESDYGAYQGGFNVVRSLATLGFDTTRGGYFRSELLAALRILGHGDVTPHGMLGSWAGAMGQPQFMPTAYLTYAVDFDGTGRRDIWGDPADVLASIANYLVRSGWRAGESWGRQVLPPARSAAFGGASRSLGEWSRAGFRNLNGSRLTPAGEIARLVSPAGAGGPAYLVGPNFQAIRRYNPSDFYALAVGLLGDLVVT